MSNTITIDYDVLCRLIAAASEGLLVKEEELEELEVQERDGPESKQWTELKNEFEDMINAFQTAKMLLSRQEGTV